MKSMVTALIAFFPAFLKAQVDITATLDLQLGSLSRSALLLAPIESLGTGIVFRTLPYPASCPTVIPGDFELKKSNPGPVGHATWEYVGRDCHTVDSVKVDTGFVYELSTSENKTYYMRLLEASGSKVKVRITSERPVVGILRKRGSRPYPEGDTRYQADGRIGREPGSSIRFPEPSGARVPE